MDVAQMAQSMINAVSESLGNDWREVRHFAEPELKRLATVLRDISTMVAEGEISPEEAKSLLRIHRKTTETVMLAVKGMGLLAVENAINAALDVVGDAVNTASGFAIL